MRKRSPWTLGILQTPEGLYSKGEAAPERGLHPPLTEWTHVHDGDMYNPGPRLKGGLQVPVIPSSWLPLCT